MPNWFDVLQFFQAEMTGSDIGMFDLCKVTEDLGISLNVAVETHDKPDITISSDNEPEKRYRWKTAKLYKFMGSWFIEYPIRYGCLTRQVDSKHYAFIDSAVLSLLETQRD